MKKMICLIMAVILAAAGAVCFAEGTEESVTFLRIRENTTANVYENPGDAEAADILDAGSVCVLVEETETAGTAWYRVFYLNSRKEGAIGYIKADDAEKLSRDQLGELMNDPDQINKLLDLVEALNDYTNAEKQKDVIAENKTDNRNQSGSDSSRSGFEDLYNKAMDELAKLFSTDAAVLEKIPEAAKEAAETAMEAGKELLEAAAEGAADLLEKAGDALDNAGEAVKNTLEKAGEDLEEKLEEILPEAEKALDSLKEGVSDALESVRDGSVKEDLDELLDKVTEGLDSLKKDAEEKYAEIEKDVQETLDTLNKSFGSDTGDALDKINELVGKAQELLNSEMIQGSLSALSTQFREEGFTEGANTVSTLIQLISNMQ